MNELKRTFSPELDKILGKKFNVLDDGFIRVIDYMGDDSSIVQAARVSYGRGTKKVQDDKNLIRYLIRNRHTSPFEMCELKLHVRVPLYVWAQWIRHRTASVNQYSTRYSIAIKSMQKTKPDEWRSQSPDNKQGSKGHLGESNGLHLSDAEYYFQESAQYIYQRRLDMGVAREQARKDLPVSTYTEAYWKIDLHNLLHFLSLRMNEHAQYEIRQYANIIGNDIVARWVPITWQAFLDYRFKSISLSTLEIQAINLLITNNASELMTFYRKHGWDKEKSRERQEFEAKLKKLGIDYH